MYVVDMKEANHLEALEKTVTAFKPVMEMYHREHHACKFQMAVDVVFHKAVEHAVITVPPVTLTSEMVTVYAGYAPPLEDVNRQLLNLVGVYEHDGSGFFFSFCFPSTDTLAHRSSSCQCFRTLTSMNTTEKDCSKCHWNRG